MQHGALSESGSIEKKVVKAKIKGDARMKIQEQQRTAQSRQPLLVARIPFYSVLWGVLYDPFLHCCTSLSPLNSYGTNKSLPSSNGGGSFFCSGKFFTSWSLLWKNVSPSMD